MNRETRTRWYNHKCSKCSAHPFVIIIRIVLYALVRYLRPTLYYIRVGKLVNITIIRLGKLIDKVSSGVGKLTDKCQH